MKTYLKHMTVTAAFLLSCSAALAQNYNLSWYKIAGGGGTSAGGTFSLSGTIGQVDAQLPPVMNGDRLTLTGGFWTATQVCFRAGDMNHDGQVNGADIQSFLNCVLSGTGDCDCADMNGGGLDWGDIDIFVNTLIAP